jgi:hypothetical protein
MITESEDWPLRTWAKRNVVLQRTNDWILEGWTEGNEYTRGERIRLLFRLVYCGKKRVLDERIEMKVTSLLSHGNRKVQESDFSLIFSRLEERDPIVNVPEKGGGIRQEKITNGTVFDATASDALNRKFERGDNSHLEYGDYTLEIHIVGGDQLDFTLDPMKLNISKDREDARHHDQ